VDPVGADDDVVLPRRTIGMGHADRIVFLNQCCHGGVEPHRYTDDAIEEESMKLAAVDAHTGADGTPNLRKIDVGQMSSGVIENSLTRHGNGSSQHLVRKTERFESSNAVAGEVKAGAGCWPRGRALDDFRRKAPLAQRSPERETGDPATDNQDA
jgi:hypothetical protein